MNICAERDTSHAARKGEPATRAESVAILPELGARAILLIFLFLGLTSIAYATGDNAARFYEDALKRFERDDVPGAVIQLKNALQRDNRMLAAHLLLGKALLKNGELKGAEAAFEAAIKQGVHRGEVALPLGQTYLALGRPELVIERIPASGLPSHLLADVLSMRGTAYAELGKTRLASESFEEAKALDPQSVVPLIAEVPVLLAAGQRERARGVAAKAVEMAPGNAYAWNMHASVLHAALDVAGALKAYDKALALEPRHADARVARAALLLDLQRERDAEADLNFLKQAAPGEPRAAYLRAMMASRNGNEPAVAAALNEAVKSIDAVPLSWLSGREQLLMVGALSHHGLGNWEKAREYLNIALTRNARNAAAKKLLAAIYLEMKDYSRALTQLEALHKAAPDDPQVLFMLGSVHLAQRRHLTATEMLEKAAALNPSPDINRTLAFSQLEMGRGERGLATLEKVFSANPGDVRAGTRLAMLYLRRGERNKAVQIAEAMVQREASNLSALHFMGIAKAATADTAGARAAFSQVLAKDPAFRPAALNLARLDASEKRFDDARRRLVAMLDKHHDATDVLFELGRLEERAGRYTEAVRHLQKANEVQRHDARAALALVELQLQLREVDQALATAKDVASKHPDKLATQLVLGRAQLAAGDHSNARRTFHGATRLAEFDPHAQVKIARLQIAAGNPDGALYNVQKALLGRPDDVAALALVVEIEMLRGDAAKADAALKSLTAKHPRQVATALASGHLAMARGRKADAIAAFRTAFSLDETTANALRVASAYLAAGDTTKAATFLDGWVKTHPSDIAAIKALAETQFRAGQLFAAQRNYARAVASQPDDATTLNNYANLLHKLNDPAARTNAEKALSLAPNNPAFLDTLGWILVQQGQADSGLRYLREARLRSPDNADIRFHLAVALARTAREDEAREELIAALRGPHRVENSEDVIRLKKQLKL